MLFDQLREDVRLDRDRQEMRRQKMASGLARRKSEIDRYVLFANIGGVGLSLPILTTYLVSEPRVIAVTSFATMVLFGFGAYLAVNGLSHRFVCSMISSVQYEADSETKSKLVGTAWIGGGDKSLKEKVEFHANVAFWNEMASVVVLAVGALILIGGLGMAVFSVAP